MSRNIKARPQLQELLLLMIRFPQGDRRVSKLEQSQSRTLLVWWRLSVVADQLPGYLLNNYFISDLAVLTINPGGTKESNGSKFFQCGENSAAAGRSEQSKVQQQSVSPGQV